MEIDKLPTLNREIPSQGFCLSQIDAIKIQCSLKLLQNQMLAEKMYFLGKIFADKCDYYLAFSTNVNVRMPATFFCSQDAVTWFSLTGINPDLLEEAISLHVPFSGLLIREVTLPSGNIITEEQRLAALAKDMHDHCILVPRGALVQTALNYVLPNPMWNGIPLAECQKLKNFRHWKPRTTEFTPLDKFLSNPAFDFLEPIESIDEWGFTIPINTNEVQLRSIRWPGFVFSLHQDTYVNCYFGNGIAEANLAIVPPRDDVTLLHQRLQ